MSGPAGTDEDRRVQVAANILALAIERIQVDQAIEQRVEQRTRDIEQRLVAVTQATAVLEERQRLARDLHDSVVQALYGVTLHAEVARRLLTTSDALAASGYLRTLQDTAQEALDEMRLLIFELRPPILEQAGLVAALQGRLDAVEGRANLQTRLIVEGAVNLPPVAEQALYRIAQEALNNAFKHAHARNSCVHLRQKQATVMLEIIDDGIGFDQLAANDTGGQGLRGITERVARLGGQLCIQSAPGAGARLRVEVGL
jgi:signal transduction histidine kinase